MAMFLVFVRCTQDNLEYLTLNKNRQAIQIHHSMLDLLFEIHCLCTVVFLRVINRQVFKSNLFI